jgi:hypothetical protein
MVDRRQLWLWGRPGAGVGRRGLADGDGHGSLRGGRGNGCHAAAAPAAAASASASAEMLWLPGITAAAATCRGDVGHDLRGLLHARPDRDGDRVGKCAETAERERAADHDAEREHHQQGDHTGPARRDNILRLILRLRLVVDQWVVGSDRWAVVLDVGERDRDPRRQRPTPGAAVDGIGLIGGQRRGAFGAARSRRRLPRGHDNPQVSPGRCHPGVNPS